MRRSSLVSLESILVLFGIFFLYIDPLLADNRWTAFIVYMLMFVSLRFLDEKLQDRYEYLNKRMEAQTSVWFVIAILLFFYAFIKAFEYPHIDFE